MRMEKNFQYYVEGDTERKILEVLKTDLRCIVAGKVNKFNVVQNKFSALQIRTLRARTTVVLVFDTDKKENDTLEENIAYLQKQENVEEVICVPQIKNLEDELIYSCNIKQVGQITHSSSVKDWKRDMLACTNLKNRLEACKFSIEKFWSRQPDGMFEHINNEAEKIKIVK